MHARVVVFARTLAVAALVLCGCGRAPTPAVQPPAAPPPVAAATDAPPAEPAKTENTGDPAESVTVAVRVRGADERPIAGARVVLSWGGCEAPEILRGNTGADGLARLKVPKDAGGVDLFVVAPHHCPLQQGVAIEELGAGPVEVTLDPAGLVRGVVRGSDGKPVHGVRVWSECDSDVDWPNDGELVSDDDGAFEIDGIRPGETFRLFARWNDGARIGERRGLVVKAAGDTLTADVTLVAPATLVVRALWPDGQPVADALVSVSRGEDAPEQRTTEANGGCEIDELVPGSWHVVAECWGFKAAGKDVTLAEGESGTIDLRPVPGPTITGVVVDDAGRPVPLAKVRVETKGAPYVGCLADGTFRIACPGESPHELHARADHHTEATLKDAMPLGEAVTIVLPRFATIRCKLLLPPGVETSARVAAWWNSEHATAELADGVVTLHVQAGRGKASFRVRGCTLVEREADTKSGETMDWGEMKVAAQRKLCGRVVDADGKPIDAFIYPKMGEKRPPLTGTHDDGTFEFDELPFGEAELHVEAKGFVRQTVRYEFTEASEPILVTLARGGGVKGRVVDADGKPAPQAVYVTFTPTDESGESDWPSIEDDGTFEVHLVAGRYKATTTLDASSAEAEVEVTDGETKDLTLKLGAPHAESAKLLVRVLWPDGLPIAGAMVTVQGEPARPNTDAQGQCEFEDLAPGHAVVEATCWGFSAARKEFDLGAGESRNVDLRPAPGPEITGVVVDAAGAPVPNARISLDIEDAPLVTCLADGTFRIACPDESPRDFHVEHDEFAGTTVEGAVPLGEAITVALERFASIRCRLVLPPGIAKDAPVAGWWNSLCTPAVLAGGVLTLRVAPGSGTAMFQVERCVVMNRRADVEPGETLDWGEMTVVAAAELKGRLVDAEGKPVDGFIYPRVGAASVPLTSTRDDGTFEFDGLPFGDAELRVHAKGFMVRTVHYEFTADSKPVVIALARSGGGVKGIVIDSEGHPVPKAAYVSFVDLRDPGDRELMSFPLIENDGTFAVELAPGRYRAKTALDALEASAEVDVVSGEMKEITLKLAEK